MVGVRENPPKVMGLALGLGFTAANTGDGIEADTMRVNMRAKTVFAKFISGHVQIFAIIYQHVADFNSKQRLISPASAKIKGKVQQLGRLNRKTAVNRR